MPPARAHVPLLLLGGLLLWLAAQGLLAMSFADSAQRWQPHDAELAQAAASQAKHLRPWSAGQAQLLATALPRDEGLNEGARALALAPADPYSWGWYAMRRSYAQDRGAGLELAVRRAWELAPHSREIAHQQALLAAYHWPTAGASLRAAWRPWLELALRDRNALARAAAQARVESGLCQALTGEHSLRRWCEIAPEFRARCSKPHESLGQDLVNRCFEAGFLG